MTRPLQPAQPARWKIASAAILVALLLLVPACRSTETVEPERAAARDLTVIGSVYRFRNENRGALAGTRVTIKGIGGGCNEEALRVVQHMPPWQAGRQSGQAVAVRYALPIRFAR